LWQQLESGKNAVMGVSLSSPPSSLGRRVLVVEDHEDCLSTMVQLLSIEGCEVRSARTGEQAIATAFEFCPELMFLDLGLPDVSGYDVARAMRADSRTAGIMIVAVTGHGMPNERSLAQDAGVDVHLVKPVPFEHLHAALMACSPRRTEDRHGRTVLVVDDNPAGRYAMARGLGASGFAVVEAALGVEAIQLADQANAIVLDVHLPDVDGREICRRLRAQPSTARTPIVHVSAVCVSDLDAEKGRLAGGDAYLINPVAPEMLARVLDSLFALRR
jgi:CheY-like chemotaxis protein